MSKRRKAREIALQGLYQYDVGNQELGQLLSFNWLNADPDNEIKKFAAILIENTIKNLENLDKYIEENSKNWDFSRIDILEKNILRFSTYSILHQKDIPVSVIINEAVDISKKFCSDDSYKFINGILDEISKKLRNR